MKQILVIQTASIGDVILASALVESLHTAFPETRIDFMVKKGNETLFHNHPFVSEVIVWDKRTKKYKNLIKIIRRIRKTNYDLVINIQRFFSSGVITVLSGALETRGFTKNPLSWFFTKRFPHDIDNGLHEVERNHALISDLAGRKHGLPRLYPELNDEEVIQQIIPGSYYTISPASLWFTKQYPVSKWVDLTNRISPEAKVLLLGAPNDYALCDEITKKSGHPGLYNLAGKLSFLQSAALMKLACMNFTNDSAPMHLASAVNAPVTAIYCSTIPGFGFGPLSTDSATIETDIQLQCRPCGLHGFARCPEKHFRCGYEIDANRVASRLAGNQ
ncbi:MAG: glycosyltransferase family 9 protein [Bacteroidetes bacterium]|nr:glycosyltransferase family 9 protein [Bacteroidota bacterium]